MWGQPSCQGHGWGAVRVPDEERETRETRETRSVGRAGDCSWPRSPAPGRGRGLRKEGLAGRLAGWLVGGLEGLVRLSVRPSGFGLGLTREGVGAWGRAGWRAGAQASAAAGSCGATATTRLRLRPYHPERARSRLISEAKQGRAWLVLGWETAWEYRVL